MIGILWHSFPVPESTITIVTIPKTIRRGKAGGAVLIQPTTKTHSGILGGFQLVSSCCSGKISTFHFEKWLSWDHSIGGLLVPDARPVHDAESRSAFPSQ